MATTFAVKLVTVDANSKKTTKTFSGISSISDENAASFGQAYTALTDYTTRDCQKITYKDIDLEG